MFSLMESIIDFRLKRGILYKDRWPRGTPDGIKSFRTLKKKRTNGHYQSLTFGERAYLFPCHKMGEKHDGTWK